MTDLVNNKTSDSDCRSPKKVYRAPKLTQWGDLQEVTLNVGKAGSPDGAKAIGTNKATH